MISATSSRVSASTTWEPIRPAPPMTTTRLPDRSMTRGPRCAEGCRERGHPGGGVWPSLTGAGAPARVACRRVAACCGTVTTEQADPALEGRIGRGMSPSRFHSEPLEPEGEVERRPEEGGGADRAGTVRGQYEPQVRPGQQVVP